MFGNSQARHEQASRQSNTQSKNSLIGFFNDLIQRTEDEQIQNDLRDFKSMISNFPPCADERARELDDKIREVMQVYFDEIFRVSTESRGKDNDAELTRGIKLEANRKMFDICTEIISSQLVDRKMMMSEHELSKKEIKGLSDSRRRRYLYQQAQRETLGDLWSIQSIVMEYSVRIQKYLFEKKSLQAIQADLLEKAKADPENLAHYQRRYNQLETEIKSIDMNEKVLCSEIDNNAKLKDIINATDIEELVNSNNSIKGSRLVDKVKKYSDKHKKLAGNRYKDNEVIAILGTNFDAEREKNMPVDRNVDKFSQSYEESRLQEKIAPVADDPFTKAMNKKNSE